MTEIHRRDHIAEVRPTGPRADGPRLTIVTDEVHYHSPAQVTELARLARRIDGDEPRKPAA
jgi:hypothetical protein